MACGDEGQAPCGGQCDWYVKGYCPFCVPWCSRNPTYCNTGLEPHEIFEVGDDIAVLQVCRKSNNPPAPELLLPAIDVKALPSRIDISSETLTGVEGFVAIIHDIDRVDFVTPDSDQVAPILQAQAGPRPRNCPELNQKDRQGRVWQHALLNLTDWHALYPMQLLVNGNWFDVDAPFDSPNVNLCTNLRGYAVTGSRTLSEPGSTDQGNSLDALLLTVSKKSSAAVVKAAIVTNAEIAQYAVPRYAVGGFVILRDGVVMDTPSSNSPHTPLPRTAVGLSADGKKLMIVVEQRGRFTDLVRGGLTAAQLARLMKHFGANSAINLDNSGSSQFVYYNIATDAAPTYISKKGDMVLCEQALRVPCSAEERRVEQKGDDVHRYRPVPNFLGIKARGR